LSFPKDVIRKGTAVLYVTMDYGRSERVPLMVDRKKSIEFIF